MTAIDVYKKMIEEFAFKHLSEKKDAIVFFQGFPGIFFQALDKTELSRLSSHDISNPSGYCDYRKIDKSKGLQAFLNSSGLNWAYYEELLSLTETLADFSVYKGEIILVKNNLFSVFFPVEVSESVDKAAEIFDDDFPDYDSQNIVSFYSDVKIDNGVGFYSYVNKHYEIDINEQVVEIDFFCDKQIAKINNNPKKTIKLNDLEVTKHKLLNGHLDNLTLIVESLSDENLQDTIELLNGIGKYFNVQFERKDVSLEVNEKLSNRHNNLFQDYWGKESSFKVIPFYKDPSTSNQTINISQGLLVSKIIEQSENALKNNNYSDIIITAPTGSGKSIFFQIPAIYLHKKHKALTIVVTPLIALMNDQVNEIQDRGVEFATFINSEITFEQRQDRLNGIKKGEYSIVYLSPELLLAYDIKSLIGERQIGLFVIDEAHLVTSWGRDFRVDYWFLGDYLEKTRKGSYYMKFINALDFPVLCLTATAVFGGRDDVVADLQKSLNLNCSSDHLFIGYVRRDSKENPINFKVNTVGIKKTNTKKDEKIDLTCERIREYIDSKRKAIIYFPYISQIEDVYNRMRDTYPELIRYVEKYSGGGMDKFEKNESYNNFKDAKVSIMLATKAFGMGINIPDVHTVYHFAPTGTLADYVQEIGRAARKLPVGFAEIDYLRDDMNYAKALWGLSGLRHYQIKAIMKKLYDLYITKGSRHLLFSPEIFGYLFDPSDIDNKVKSGLMLLSSDLLEKYRFRVINVRAKNIFSIHYINVPHSIKSEFLNIYGKYCKLMTDDKPRVQSGLYGNSDITITNTGDIYEIDLSKLWENEFENMTYAKFKYHFFNGDLFSFEQGNISPRVKLIIHYGKDYEGIKKQLIEIVEAVKKTFKDIYKEFKGGYFKINDFRNAFTDNYPIKIRNEYLNLLLDLFSYDGVYFTSTPSEQWKFIMQNKKAISGSVYSQVNYSIRTKKHFYIGNNLKRYIDNSAPNDQQVQNFITYLPIQKEHGKYSEYQLMASLLELFNLSTFELQGGRNPQIFVRVNDPMKLKRIVMSEKDYRNTLLTDIENRHKRAAEIVNGFMNIDKPDKHRWSLIEKYFLGYDDEVDEELKITY